MTTSAPKEIHPKLEVLDSLEAIYKKSKENPTKVIAVIFGRQFPDRGSLETRLVWWRHDFEKNNEVLFYKAVCARSDSKWKDALQIETLPTIVFFHHEKSLGRLDKLNEDKEDEKIVKTTIIDHCKKIVAK
ncbi:hypothetical protein I4U23_003148 [Adineta vaga]|nr:hypothetical protein I4U23_003148 [Adineta vaga]